MNWEVVSSTGEWAGALAVVITIIYLARQIRDNSKQVKLNTTQSYASLVQDAYAAVYTNEQTIRAWVMGTSDPGSLTDEEQKLYLHLMDRQINNIFPLVNHYREGAMSREEFEHYRDFFIEMTSTEGGKYWREHRFDLFRTALDSMHAA